jgi:uncharacterized spore protein YtfJ
VDEGVQRLVDAVASARLCYGEPVRAGDRTVIPVTRVRVSGGWGFGRGPRMPRQADAGGGGGGGSLEAQPAGFVEFGPDGARFHEIGDPDRTQRLLKSGAAAVTTVLAAVAGARGLSGRRAGRRRPAGLLGR